MRGIRRDEKAWNDFVTALNRFPVEDHHSILDTLVWRIADATLADWEKEAAALGEKETVLHG